MKHLTGALLTILLLNSCSAPPPAVPCKPDSSPAPESAVVIDGPRAELLAKLDAMFQSRFARITDEDLSRKRFGGDRVGLPNRMHERVFTAETTKDREALAQMADAGWNAIVYVVKERGQDGMPGRVQAPIQTGGSPWKVHDHLAVEALANRSIVKNEACFGSASGVPLEARPVLASAAICLKCHGGKSVGDPVGAVVYAFKREQPRVATPGRESGR